MLFSGNLLDPASAFDRFVLLRCCQFVSKSVSKPPGLPPQGPVMILRISVLCGAPKSSTPERGNVFPVQYARARHGVLPATCCVRQCFHPSRMAAMARAFPFGVLGPVDRPPWLSDASTGPTSWPPGPSCGPSAWPWAGGLGAPSSTPAPKNFHKIFRPCPLFLDFVCFTSRNRHSWRGRRLPEVTHSDHFNA